MSTASTTESESETVIDGESDSGFDSASDSGADSESESSSLTDKLDTAATAIRVSFLAFVVVFTLIPVIGLLAGWAPFDPPPTTPYFALVGLVLVGTVALIGAAIYDV
jgi:hypothetical protein